MRVQILNFARNAWKVRNFIIYILEIFIVKGSETIGLN